MLIKWFKSKYIKIFFYASLGIGVLLLATSFLLVKNISGYQIATLVNKLIPQTQEYFSTQDLAWAQELRQHTKEIKAEYLQYLQKNTKLPTVKEVENIMYHYDTSNIPWQVIVLRVYNRDTENMQYFPQLKKYLESVPGCSIALFSILAPGKIIKTHTGPYRGVLRYHLALETPPFPARENCQIYVNNIPYSWQEGKDLLFDDTYPHYVVNNTPYTRVILFLDVDRPLTGYKKYLHKALMFLYKYNITVDEIVNNVNKFAKTKKN